jgi:hypothetical protein
VEHATRGTRVGQPRVPGARFTERFKELIEAGYDLALDKEPLRDNRCLYSLPMTRVANVA